MSTSELGVAWDEMTGWVQEISSTFVTGVSTALQEINGFALDEAQKAELRAKHISTNSSVSPRVRGWPPTVR